MHQPAPADPLDHVRDGLAALADQPVGVHVAAITSALDAIVGELDDLARSLPQVR